MPHPISSILWSCLVHFLVPGLNFVSSKISHIFSKKTCSEKNLYFLKKSFSDFQETKFSYISGKVYWEPIAYSEHCQTSTVERFAKKLPSKLFKPKLKKQKKFLYFLIFWEMKLFSSNIKKAFFIFREKETLKKFLIFQETSYISRSNFLSSKNF